jgi:hypothetical protein
MAASDGSMEQHGDAAQRALEILAKSVFKELKRSGYNRGQMVAFASELLELVTRDAQGVRGDAE